MKYRLPMIVFLLFERVSTFIPIFYLMTRSGTFTNYLTLSMLNTMRLSQVFLPRKFLDVAWSAISWIPYLFCEIIKSFNCIRVILYSNLIRLLKLWCIWYRFGYKVFCLKIQTRIIIIKIRISWSIAKHLSIKMDNCRNSGWHN